MLRWYWVAGGLIAAELLFVASAAYSVGYQELPPILKYGYASSLPVFFYFVYFIVKHLRHLPESPMRYLGQQDWRPVGRLAGAMLFLYFQFSALTWSKGLIPKLTSMSADPFLAETEAKILGRNAYEWLPSPTAFIDVLYTLWFPALCFVFAAVYLGKRLHRDALLISFFLTIGVLGIFGQFLLPSGGPIFFERMGYGDRFVDMPMGELAIRTSHYLWRAHTGGSVGFATGISAFPSIHVAMSMWMALALRHWTGYLWLGLIFYGSIVLGWHYAADGLAGIVGAWTCYRISRRFSMANFHGAQRLVPE